LVERGRLFALSGECYWLDAGTPAAYLKAHFDLLDGVRAVPEAWGSKTDFGFVEGDGEVTVSGTVATPTYLGLGAHIAAGARVERSMIGANASIGAGAVVTNSVLHEGAFIATGARLDHVVVGANGVVGDDAVLERNTVIGAGVVVEPGTMLVEERVPN
jgi:mannose-1-phosphate guanylyltransferase